MIKIYTEPDKVNSNDLEQINDAFFNFITSTEEFTEKDKEIMQKIDNAELLPFNKIQTPFALGRINNLSTGCKTVLNILHHPEKVFNVGSCGENALNEIFSLDNIRVLLTFSSIISESVKAEFLFNDTDRVSGARGFSEWWSNEYRRRLEDGIQ